MQQRIFTGASASQGCQWAGSVAWIGESGNERWELGPSRQGVLE